MKTGHSPSMQDFEEAKLKVAEELKTDEKLVEEAASLPTTAPEAAPQASSYREWRKNRKKQSKLTPSALLFVVIGAVILALGMRYIYYALPGSNVSALPQAPRIIGGFIITLFGFLLITQPLVMWQKNDRVIRVHTVLSKAIQSIFALLLIGVGLPVPIFIANMLPHPTPGMAGYTATLALISGLGMYWMYSLFWKKPKPQADHTNPDSIATTESE
jgi:uncharacterized membrane protein YidH (DUF202 family)